MKAEWLSFIIGALALILAFTTWIRGEQLRRHSDQKELREWINKELEAIKLRVSSLEIQLQPLFAAIQKNVAMMFHQPHRAFAHLDRLIERLHASRDHLFRDLSDYELKELIDYAGQIYHQTAKGMPGENLDANHRAHILAVTLRSTLQVRELLRRQERMEAKAEQQASDHTEQMRRESEIPWMRKFLNGLAALYRWCCRWRRS